MNPSDYVSYIDTDSCYILVEDFILNNLKKKNKWLNMSEKKKLSYVKRIADNIIVDINNRTFNEVQMKDYNSSVDDFKIEFGREIIAKTALFVKKKKYACWVIDDDGSPVDKLKIMGLEVIRSDSSEAVRTRLRKVMEMIMKNFPDDEIRKTVTTYKNELKNVLPEEIAANIGVNHIKKYIIDGKPKKGTPWHVKGVANYRMLLKTYKLENAYEDISEGMKAKVIYVKKNKFGIESITFNRWVKEFNKDIQIDYDLMIDKFFLKKIGFLLNPMNKMFILNDNEKEEVLDAFFK